MKGIALDLNHADGVKLIEMDAPAPGPQEIKIKLVASALNHRDQWCREGKYPNLNNGTILGSDGAGFVEEVGNEVDPSWRGKEVIINPAIGWGANQRVQAPGFKILGMPDHGTFAEYLCIAADRVHEKPKHLSMEAAAALPLAGLTAFRAVAYHGQVTATDKVLVTGFGGGVAQLAVQFAMAMGAEVYVSSSKDWKRKKAVEIGVKDTFDYNDSEWMDQANEIAGGFDLIIDSAMGDTLTSLLEVVKPGGKMVFFGATLGNINQLNARKIFWNQIRLQGTTMGSDADFEQMLAFVADKKVAPLVDEIYPLERAVEAFEKMKQGGQLGKLVLKH